MRLSLAQIGPSSSESVRLLFIRVSQGNGLSVKPAKAFKQYDTLLAR